MYVHVYKKLFCFYFYIYFSTSFSAKSQLDIARLTAEFTENAEDVGLANELNR